MKVLVCARGYNSTKERKVGVFELDQAKALRDAGCDVRIASVDMHSIRHRRKLTTARFEIDRIPVFTVNVPAGNVPAGLYNKLLRFCGKKAFRAVCSDGWTPDIIHAHFTANGYAFAAVAEEAGVPLVITEHSSVMTREPIPKREFLQAAASYPKAAQLIAVSGFLADRIGSAFRIRPAVIHNVVQPAPAFHGDGGEAPKPFTFVSAGNLVASKGMDLLIRSFAALSGDAHLIIMGDGPERKRLEQLADDSAAADRIVFTGRYQRDEFYQTLSQADAFVLASRVETFGVVYVEALMTGIPVIATRCGGPEEFVTERNGLLVPADDAAALTEAMRTMMKNAGTYDREAIRRDAEDSFSPRVIAEQLIQLYKGI